MKHKKSLQMCNADSKYNKHEVTASHDSTTNYSARTTNTSNERRNKQSKPNNNVNTQKLEKATRKDVKRAKADSNTTEKNPTHHNETTTNYSTERQARQALAQRKT